MNRGGNELRNIVLTNIKRLQHLEGTVEKLNSQMYENQKLLELIEEIKIESHNMESIYSPLYLQEIFSNLNTNFRDFMIPKESEPQDAFFIPEDFFDET